MDEVLEVWAEDLCCQVQAGVTREQLNRYLRDTGLYFPIDPGANATLGGMVATRASGTNTVRYGTMRENVLGLHVVLPDGKVVRTGSRAAKSAAGYDLTSLFIGSEGTLGIITEVLVRLHPRPAHVAAATCHFASLEAAVTYATRVMQQALPVARIELIDAEQVRASNAYSKLALPIQPMLLLELHGGSASALEEHGRELDDLANEVGATEFRWAMEPSTRSRLWEARHHAYFAAKAARPGCEVWATDVCVPISCLAEAIAATRRDLDSEQLAATIVGHVGDGNFHVLFRLDPQDATAWEAAARVDSAMVNRAIAMGGTCTGEHGIGAGKKAKLLLERGAPAIDLMRSIKEAIDPAHIMNPGKVLDLSGA